MSELGGSRLQVWIRTRMDDFRGSLFGRPAIWVTGSVVVAIALLELDSRLGVDVKFIVRLRSTVDGSRALLGAIASGTIAAASVVFSLTLVAIQLSSSAYSSRVSRTFLRDRFQQNVIGLVMGTYAYSMIVLREIRSPLEDGGDAIIPKLSILVATLLALASLLALIASINHTAQNLRVATVTRKLVAEIKRVIADQLPRDRDDPEISVQAPGTAPNRLGPDSDIRSTLPDEPGVVFTSPRSGWIEQISLSVIGDAVAQDSTVELMVAAGSYVFEGSPLLTIWPAPAVDDAEHQREHLRGAFAIGGERTLLQDIAFGLVLLEDISVRALSPGINDPNTASVVIPQLGELIFEILSRPLPPAVQVHGRCTYHRPSEAGYGDYVDTAFTQIRRCAAGQPSVTATLIRALHTVGDELIRRRQVRAGALDALRALLHEIDVATASSELSATDRAELLALLDQIPWLDPEPAT